MGTDLHCSPEFPRWVRRVEAPLAGALARSLALVSRGSVLFVFCADGGVFGGRCAVLDLSTARY